MENNIAIEKNRQRKPLLGSSLLLLLLGGWFYPPLGYFMIVCMVMAMGIGAIKGRHWCDWTCPRGSFWDTFLGRFSRNVKAPSLFRSLPFPAAVAWYSNGHAYRKPCPTLARLLSDGQALRHDSHCHHRRWPSTGNALPATRVVHVLPHGHYGQLAGTGQGASCRQ